MTLNGSLHVDRSLLEPVTDLTLGYGSSLTLDGSGTFSLNSLVMQQGDSTCVNGSMILIMDILSRGDRLLHLPL